MEIWLIGRDIKTGLCPMRKDQATCRSLLGPLASVKGRLGSPSVVLWLRPDSGRMEKPRLWLSGWLQSW